ncbi:hypothetical protein EYC84_001902 [Monilinia fructicola]|uniref:Zn(2)-C6 fungal-type domain-containing protein n=1 Tax=Monilinia fructicola TaxID=38448 RepID=A0A5M9JTL5_MONFR|nr:hypothetical protein EYC84_001902 [Monilinia fructicola]
MSSTTPSTPSQKPRRILACMFCQQRKIKCDRKHPCSHCTKSRVQCVPATQVPRQRRRRFPERELLDRLRQYEDLLRQNNIKFEPLHQASSGGKESSQADNLGDSDDEQPKIAGPNASSPSSNFSSDRVYGVTNVWHAMSQEFREPDNHSDSSDDDVREADVKKAWDQVPENDNFLFGSRITTVDISTLHPDPVQIFRLWQIYLENVNPLLKVTHTPSLQGLIIDAASNVSNIKPNLEALMFGIYSMSISSLSVEDCQLMFSSSKTDLLTRYHFGCQQGLLNSGFLRNRDDMHCLTALFFYLLSIRTNSVPQSLSSMLAVAIRIAQRMGCHSELALSKLSPLQAEMRRRLWWSLVLYDTRIGELSDSKHAILAPTWDCKIPLNASDSDFHMEMKDPPQIQGKPTEAIFTVLRCELADFIRNTTFHLGFSNPALKPAAKDTQHDPSGGDSELANLEKLIEDRYLQFCDPENPIHFMTIWTTRLSIAQMASGRTLAFLREKLLLKKQAWEAMTANYEARFHSLPYDEIPGPFFKIFAKIIVQAWEVREQALRHMGDAVVEPTMVLRIRRKIAKLAEDSHGAGAAEGGKDMGANAFSMVAPVGFYGVGDEHAYPGAGAGPGIPSDMWGFWIN